MIVFQAHHGLISSLAFSPSGEGLATADAQATRLWSAPYRAPALELAASVSWGACLAFSPDGQYLARTDNTVHVWRLAAPDVPVFVGAELYSSLQGCFSPDGRQFVVQATHAPLLRRETGTWTELPGRWGATNLTVGGESAPLGCLAYHPDGSRIAYGFAVFTGQGPESVIYLWDAATGDQRGALRCPYHSAHPSALAFSPDGRYLAVLYGPSLRVWDVAKEAEVAHHREGRKHFKGLAFTPDGSRLVTVSNDKTVRLWETATWSEVGAYEWKVGKLGAVAVSPDGMRMAAGGDRGKVVVWDVD